MAGRRGIRTSLALALLENVSLAGASLASASLACASLACASLACADGALPTIQSAFPPTEVHGAAGTPTAIAHWQIQSSAKAQEGGADISSAGFSTEGWYPVSGRATVMAGLIENGEYPNVFYGDNLRAVEEPDASGSMFVIPWWYRSVFTVDGGAPGARTLLRINGVIPAAEVWLNGRRVADRATVAGAYPVQELDVTPWIQAGANTLALRVVAGDPRTSLGLGWVDWNPTPPDNNMGPWRGYRTDGAGRTALSARDLEAVAARPRARRTDRER
jgi:exo-1,4-beta-D-glucosaminidase